MLCLGLIYMWSISSILRLQFYLFSQLMQLFLSMKSVILFPVWVFFKFNKDREVSFCFYCIAWVFRPRTTWTKTHWEDPKLPAKAVEGIIYFKSVVPYILSGYLQVSMPFSLCKWSHRWFLGLSAWIMLWMSIFPTLHDSLG